MLFVCNIYFFIAILQLLNLRKFTLFRSWGETLIWSVLPIVGFWAALLILPFSVNDMPLWIQSFSEDIRVEFMIGIGVNLLTVFLQALMLGRYLRQQDAVLLGAINLLAFSVSAMVAGYDFLTIMDTTIDLTGIITSPLVIIFLVGLSFGFIYSVIISCGFLWVLYRTASRAGVYVDFPKLSRVFVSSLGLLIVAITTYAQAPQIHDFALQQLNRFPAGRELLQRFRGCGAGR
jgi:hypothetical protein